MFQPFVCEMTSISLALAILNKNYADWSKLCNKFPDGTNISSKNETCIYLFELKRVRGTAQREKKIA